MNITSLKVKFDFVWQRKAFVSLFIIVYYFSLTYDKKTLFFSIVLSHGCCLFFSIYKALYTKIRSETERERRRRKLELRDSNDGKIE